MIASVCSVFITLFPNSKTQANPSLEETLDIDSNLIQNSPVLKKWGTEIPNLLEDIRNDPSFNTKVKLGIVQYPSSDDLGGFQVGIEDVFFGTTGITASIGYSQSLNADRVHFEGDLFYSLFPLGNYFNLAPVVGYHYLETEDYQEDGLNVGLQLRLVLSRTDAADIRLTQSFLSPGKETEVGLTTLAVGYAVSDQLRLGVEIQKQNAAVSKDSRVGVLTQWQFP